MKTGAAMAMAWVSLLAGCDSRAPASVEAAASRGERAETLEFPLYQTPADCAAGGGTWQAWCVPNKPGCVMTYPDGGRKCSDSSECDSGVCMVDDEEKCVPGQDCEPLAQPKTGEPAVGICKRQNVQCELVITVKDGKAVNPYDASDPARPVAPD